MNDTLKTINMLRSARNDFIDKEIPQNMIKCIIDHSMKAANASNVQRYSMIYIDDKELLTLITNKTTTKYAIVYCLDYNRIIETAHHMGYEYKPGTDNWYDIISGIFDVSALAQTAVIAAASLGIDTVITNSVLRQNQSEIVKRLNLPEKFCIAVMAVLFGYRDIPQKEQMNRLPQDYIVHHNHYHSLREEDHDSIIKIYDQIYPQYMDESHPHYLDYFFKEWCSPSKDDYNKELKERMKEAGFEIK